MIVQGRIYKPLNMMLFGIPGIGKSTFASGAPDPLFIGAEENDELQSKRMPQSTTFDEFEKQLGWILKEKPTFGTLVIDSIDSIERLLHAKILADDGKAKAMNKAAGGYGAGFDIAEKEMTRVRDQYLKPIRESGKNVITIAHCKKTTAVDTVVGFQYDTYEMNLHHKVQAVFVDWCSAVLFANYLTFMQEDKNSDKVFGVGQGHRMLYTEKRPGHLGKNRFDLPYQIEFSKENPFGPFWEKFQAFYAGEKPKVEDLLNSIGGLLEFNELKDDFRDKVRASVKDANGDVDKLIFIKNKLSERVGG